EAPSRLVESEHAAVGDQPDRSAGTVDVVGAAARRADEADFWHERAARVLGAKQDDLGHDVIEMRRAERAGEAHLRMVMLADADQVDVALAVDLAARKEEHVDAPLAGAVEQLAPAVGEEVVLAALQQRYVRPSIAARAAEQGGSRRNRRGVAHRDV